MSADDTLKAIYPAAKAPATEEEREKATLDWFDRNLGAGDELAYTEILAIAKGLISEEHLDRNGNPSTKRPSYSDRLAAWDLLINRHRGRPAQKVEVTTKSSNVEKWNPEMLELDDLRELRRLRAKLAKAEVTPIIDGDFTLNEGSKK